MYFSYDNIFHVMTVYIHNRLLIEYMKDDSEPAWKGYFYAVLIFVPAVVQSIIYEHYFIRCFIVGMHFRTSIISMVYNKVRVR